MANQKQQLSPGMQAYCGLIIGIILIVILLLLGGCKKEDYTLKPPPFQVGDKVRLDGIDPRKSFQPYDCCTCPCTVTGVYKIADQIYWWYSIVDLKDSTLTHVPNNDLKRWVK